MNTDTLEARLRKLEKQNRLLTTSLLLGVLLVACTSAMIVKQGPLASSEVRANRFVLVDGNDKEIGVWETNRSGLPSLAMGTESSSPAVRIAQEGDSATLSLNSPSANKASLTVTNNTSSLSLPGGDSTGRGHISLSGNSAPSIQMVRADESSLSFVPGGTPFILRSQRAKGRDDWSIGPTGMYLNGFKLKLNDYNGKPIKELP